MILGGLIFLVVWASFLRLNRGENSGLGSRLLVYVVPWRAGFQQNVTYALAQRILRVIVGEAEVESWATGATEGK